MAEGTTRMLPQNSTSNKGRSPVRPIAHFRPRFIGKGMQIGVTA